MPPINAQPCILQAPRTEETSRVYTPEALKFLGALEEKFSHRRAELLQQRAERQQQYDAGQLPDFNPDTAHIRQGDWTIAPIPEALKDRRTEITGPVDRKMMINALNSGAKVFMADFEDANAPTFNNILNGHINVQDYATGDLTHTDQKSGKYYELNPETAYMIVRPRGWHLDDVYLQYNDRPVSGALADFGLHIFHTGHALWKQGLGPFYYIPKLESHLEARLWNDVFIFAQDYLDIPQATIKATILIETLPAAFEMDEILYELKDHIAGLNCGRWDYIFSYIKTLRNHQTYILPDRGQVTMDKDFLLAYSQKLIETCHKRGAHAMGGMAAQIPIKNDEPANALAFDKVRADKLREVTLGHDGTWVAHPALVPVALEIFNHHMPERNQLSQPYDGPDIVQSDLLQPHQGHITESGVRTNISVAIEYIAAWLGGRGAVPIHNLMEDAATAEICRMQLWQWLKFGCAITTDDSSSFPMDEAHLQRITNEEYADLEKRCAGNADLLHNLSQARRVFEQTIRADEFQNFLTLPAYSILTQARA